MSLETLILTELLVVLSLGLGVTALFTIYSVTLLRLKDALKFISNLKPKTNC